MIDIPVTDNADLTADLKLPDDSPLAKSKFSHLNFLALPVIGDFDKPIDQAGFKEVAFGAAVQSPAILLAGGAKLTIKPGAAGSIGIVKNADKTLFGDDQFSPRIPIAADECWVKAELDTTVEGKIAGKVDGIGLSIDGTSKAAFATYSLFQRTGGAFPTFKSALETAFGNFSIALSPAAIRSQKVGTVNVTETGGTIKFAASYSIPISTTALATADLPFGQKFSVKPDDAITVKGELSLSGDFAVRCHKINSLQVEFGVYKKRGVALQATFTTGVGLGFDVGQQDILTTVLGAALPGVDLKAAGIDGSAAGDLRDVLKECINHHLGVSVNAQFTDGFTHEAAVVYTIDLSPRDTAPTDSAIASALKGDWTPLDSLENAKSVQNIFKNTKDTRHRLQINLLGIYNAENITEFTRSCTVLRDANNQITITDKVKAAEISVATKPFAADSNKLQRALAEAYLATATYAAAFTISVSQTYFQFADSMTSAQMRKEQRLALALGQTVQPLTEPSYKHVRIEASLNYDTNGAQRVFFADTSRRTARDTNELEAIGRGALIELLDGSDPMDAQRIAALKNDAVWQAMNQEGAIDKFGEIPELSALPPTLIQDVGGNWLDIVTWAKAVSQVGPALRNVLDANGPEVAAKRKALANTLAGVAKNSRAAYAGGWGLAVTANLLGSLGARKFDAVWDGNSSVTQANFADNARAARR